MPSYHFSAQIIKRSANRSVVASAAYRAGDKLRDERNGKVFNYANRRGVSFSDVMVPEGTPERYRDREVLWNEVEAMEKRKDAQLAREINVALPYELSESQRLSLLLGFVKEQFVDKGMIADIAVHDPVPENGDDYRNFHAHILLSLRRVTEDGFHRVKTREWNSKKQMKEWRKSWEEHQNEHLERAGIEERVDHRTLKEQSKAARSRGDYAKAKELDRTPEIHVGVASRQMAQKHGKGWSGFLKLDKPYPNITAWCVMNQPKWKKFESCRAMWNFEIIKHNKAKAEAEHKQLLVARMKALQEQSRLLKTLNNGKPTVVSILNDGVVKDIARQLITALGAKEFRNARYYEYLQRCIEPDKQMKRQITRNPSLSMQRERPYPQ